MINIIKLFIFDINNILCYYGIVFKNILTKGLRLALYNHGIYLFGLTLTVISYGVMLYSPFCSCFTLNLTMIIVVTPLTDVTFTVSCVASLVVTLCILLTAVCCLSKCTVTAVCCLSKCTLTAVCCLSKCTVTAV